MRRALVGLMFVGSLFALGCGDDDYGEERLPADLSADLSAVGDLEPPRDLAGLDLRVPVDMATDLADFASDDLAGADFASADFASIDQTVVHDLTVLDH